MKRSWQLFSIFALAFLWQAAPLSAEEKEEGFTSIFNGKDLTDWDGDPKFWSVKDEAITGTTTKENPTNGNTFIIWTGGETGDFELKLQYKIINGNSGIQYRSFGINKNDKWRIGGYQADFEAGQTYSGILYGEAFRGILANRGQKTDLVIEDGKFKVKETGKVGDSKEIQAKIKKEDWNDYHIVAKGFTFKHYINGAQTIECEDKDEKARKARGLLALQLHAGPPMVVQFRNIRVKGDTKKAPAGALGPVDRQQTEIARAKAEIERVKTEVAAEDAKVKAALAAIDKDSEIANTKRAAAIDEAVKTKLADRSQVLVGAIVKRDADLAATRAELTTRTTLAQANPAAKEQEINARAAQEAAKAAALDAEAKKRAAIAAQAVENAKPQAAGKKKVVFVAGNKSHGFGSHDHKAGCHLLANQLNASGLPIEAVVTYPGWPKDMSVFDGAAAIVIYADGGGGHPMLRNLKDMKVMMDKGVGLGCIHYGVEVPKGNAGDAMLDWTGGYFETFLSVNPHWTLKEAIVAKDHPITNGVKPYSVNDEWYYHMRFRQNMDGVTPILSALPPADTMRGFKPGGKASSHGGNDSVYAAVMEKKEPQAVMWARQRPAGENVVAGRGFGFTGGHVHWNWVNDHHRKLVLNGVAWIANVDVPKDGVPNKTPTLEEMLENHDEEIPGNFNKEEMAKKLAAMNGQ